MHGRCMCPPRIYARFCSDLPMQGIWTTQVQNGEILSDAFSKCKNVILFFSINKSRAFQGYVRCSLSLLHQALSH